MKHKFSKWHESLFFGHKLGFNKKLNFVPYLTKHIEALQCFCFLTGKSFFQKDLYHPLPVQEKRSLKFNWISNQKKMSHPTGVTWFFPKDPLHPLQVHEERNPKSIWTSNPKIMAQLVYYPCSLLQKISHLLKKLNESRLICQKIKGLAFNQKEVNCFFIKVVEGLGIL